MKYIQEHKTLFVVSIVCVILLLLMIFAIYSMFNPKNKTYNDNEVPIPDEAVDTIKSLIDSSSITNSVTYNENARVIKFIINVKDDTKVEDCYSLANIILDNFSKEVLSYYDVQVMIKANNDSYPMIGYHSTGATEFTWTLNRGEVSE